MRVLVDMNLSPTWTQILSRSGIESIHWSQVGDPRATDATVMRWAREHAYVVFTHDLDFSALLASTGATGPSVVQLRTQDVLSAKTHALLIRVLQDHAQALENGSIVTVEETQARVRILPLGRLTAG